MKVIRKPGWDELVAADLTEDELRACLTEAARRGLDLPRLPVEAAYEVLLEGRPEVAAGLLSSALFQNGVDDIKARVEAHKALAVRAKNQKAA